MLVSLHSLGNSGSGGDRNPPLEGRLTVNRLVCFFCDRRPAFERNRSETAVKL